MGCLGVLFAVTEEQIQCLKEVARKERPDYISDELEEEYFSSRRSDMEELDKAWDAMHRVLTDGQLLYGDACAPLSGVVLGGEVLYGDGEDECDYIITYKTPEQVKEIASALQEVTEQWFRRRYFALDEKLYDFELSEEDFEYTWEYASSSVPFWEQAARQGYGVIFTVDQ